MHLSLFHLTGFKAGHIPQDERYKFHARATRVLELWDSEILADLKSRKIRWALKGHRSLIYLRKDDGKLSTTIFIIKRKRSLLVDWLLSRFARVASSDGLHIFWFARRLSR